MMFSTCFSTVGREMEALAGAANNVQSIFETTVMGGAPIFSLSRRGEALPAAGPERFRVILNFTTNLMVTEMECGSTFEQAVGKAQDRTQLGCAGIAETDPALTWTAGTPR